MQQASGQIASIDPAQRRVIIHQRGSGTTEFIIDDHTDISRAIEDSLSAPSAATMSLNDLSPGATIRVNYTLEDGRRVARSIVIGQPSRG